MEKVIPFPDPATLPQDELLWVGGPVTSENLVAAYQKGIFPWPQPGFPILWFSPKDRGVLEFREFRIPRRLRSFVKNHAFRLTFDQAFEQVIEACAQVPRSHESGTWILPEMQKAYIEFHHQGYAHSVECWEGTELVGGLYGVYVQGVFSGESMFHRRDHTSKLCLIHLVEFLRKKGIEWMDIQMVTPVLRLFGGKYIDRSEFLKMLRTAQVGGGVPLDFKARSE